MPKPYHYDRKVHRDDPVLNAIVNFYEDLDGVQALICDGEPGRAKAESAAAVLRLNLVLSPDCVREFSVSINPVGRLETFIHYVDPFGEMRLTYTARQPR